MKPAAAARSMFAAGVLTWQTAGGPSESSYYSFNVFVKRDGRWQYVAAFTP